jgi:hypothetical protein
MQTTITLKTVSCGTGLNIVQEGRHAVIPAEACYLGWQESLALLAKLVEAEIPDQRENRIKTPITRICHESHWRLCTRLCRISRHLSSVWIREICVSKWFRVTSTIEVAARVIEET